LQNEISKLKIRKIQTSKTPHYISPIINIIVFVYELINCDLKESQKKENEKALMCGRSLLV
jgi:hypothetical protein